MPILMTSIRRSLVATILLCYVVLSSLVVGSSVSPGVPTAAKSNLYALSWLQYADPSGSNAAFDVVVSPVDGSVFVVGGFSSNFTLGSTVYCTADNNQDVFLAKFDAHGALKWLNCIGGAGPDVSYTLAVSPDGTAVFLSGNFGGCDGCNVSFSPTFQVATTSGQIDLFVVKYSAIDGTAQWAKHLSSFSQATSVAVSRNSAAVYVCGQFAGSITFGIGEPTQVTLQSTGGSFDYFVARFKTQDGRLDWAKVGGTTQSDAAQGCVVSNNDDFLFVTGIVSQGSAFYNNGQVVPAVIFFGGADIFLAKYFAQNGSLAWIKTAGSAWQDSSNGVAISPDDNSVVIVGWYNTAAIFGSSAADAVYLNAIGGTDIFLAKYSVWDGTLLWARTAGSLSSDSGQSIDTALDGSIFITGQFVPNSAKFGQILVPQGENTVDIFVAKYDSTGNALMVKRLGSLASDGNGYQAVAFSPLDYSFVLSGNIYTDHAQFDTNYTLVLPSNGMTMYTAKYTPYCVACGTGTYNATICPQNATMDCYPCDIGYYQDYTGQSSCKKCPAHQFANTSGLASCFDCDPGFIASPDSSNCSTRVTCAAGQYFDLSTLVCRNCSVGSYQDQISHSLFQCSLCPAGTRGIQEGARSKQEGCRTCSQGQYQDQQGQQICLSCGVGNYSTESGLDSLSKCKQCGMGTWSDKEIASGCVPCKSGYFSAAIAASSIDTCQECAAGSYQEFSGQSQCTPCAKGTFSMTPRADSASFCIPCPRGSYSNKTGQSHWTSCISCEAGSYADKAGLAECSKCPLGQNTSFVGAVSFAQACGSTAQQLGTANNAVAIALPIAIGVPAIVLLFIVLVVLVVTIVLVALKSKNGAKGNTKTPSSNDDIELKVEETASF